VVEPAFVAALSLPPGRIRSTRWEMLLERLRREGGRPELITAIETALREGSYMASRSGRLDRSLSRGLTRIGLSPERMVALDRRALAGAGHALYRRIRRLLA
jgi:hypothetical protein